MYITVIYGKQLSKYSNGTDKSIKDCDLLLVFRHLALEIVLFYIESLSKCVCRKLVITLNECDTVCFTPRADHLFVIR